MRADVVILALDRPEETEAAIASALAQQGVSRHVFVVDQGSHANSLARLARAVAGREDATLVSLRRNLGVAGGRNRGAALGHGRVIVGLDNDALFGGPDTLARAVAGFEDDPALPPPGSASWSMRRAPTTSRPGAIRGRCCRAPARRSRR
ncbi:MAG: glycosyltransferase family 2 protein [Pseudomonadota bacterium]|nr:glycosyltransferase family 2 protein [Pseudomonadota bacterium]